MKFSKTYVAAIGAVLIAGALFSGAAFAAAGSTGSTEKAATAQTEKESRKGARVARLSEGAQATWQELSTLRQSAMEKLKADSKALVGNAVKSGKITQEEADKLLAGGRRHGRHGGPGKFGPVGKGGFGNRFATQEEFKAHLDAEVKAGKHTQEEADKLLQQWAQKQAPAGKN